MLSILKGEFRKIFTSKSLIVCVSILGGMAFLNAFSTYLLYSGFGLLGDSAPEVIERPFREILLGSMTSNSFFILLSVFLAIWNLRDYTTGSIKNMIAKGCSRNSIYFAKYIVTLVVTLAYTLVNALVTVGFSAIFMKFTGGFTFEVFEFFMLDIFMVLTLATVYFGFIMLTQKLAPAIIINLMLGSVIQIICVVIDLIVNSETMLFQTLHLETAITMTLGGSSLSSAILQGIFNTPEIGANFMLHMLIVCVIYIALFITVSYLVNRKKEY
ncbi:MAG: ABC transporter permease [Clostridiales bacterium]|nr:ABC transporter permease [Clostridiales bacterium]